MKAAAMQLDDPFAPLEDAPTEPTAASGTTVITPVPDSAPEASFIHPSLGTPSAVWTYRAADGAVLNHVARFDKEDGGKEFAPRSWCRWEGGEGWGWKALPQPRPLYRLPELAARPDAPVIVVEGEKSADAAAKIFADHVVVTWSGGTGGVAAADLEPLRGRTVFLWPDADEPGAKAMIAAERIVKRIADAVQVVRLPEGLPPKWDLADPVPDGIDIHEVLHDTARGGHDDPRLPAGYRLGPSGLWWDSPDADKEALLLADALEVVAETRDVQGESWGILLRWHDHDGRQHRLPIPRASLAGDGADARRLLMDGGLHVSTSRGAREKFNSFLGMVRSSNRVTATNRVGWHRSAFVLPDRTLGRTDGEDMLLQTSSPVEHAFRTKGSLEEWKREVAAYAPGNSRLVLAVATAFAAPLLYICEMESGGFHLRGPSSIGKSTALVMAGSVWGGGDRGYVRNWRATANGLEAVGSTQCDTLLCLDEISQIASKEAGEAAYMLANGLGKARAARDGGGRRPASWRVLFLSSGEVSLADKIAEDGLRRRATAGQQVRVIDIAADAGAGLGLFEDLHGFGSGDDLARHLKEASLRNYGVAAEAFVDRIAGDDGVRRAVDETVRRFCDDELPPNADGQVRRVSLRFALAAAAAELAIAAGILPWKSGEGIDGVARCCRDWLRDRGSAEPAEIRDGIAQVRAFLHAHGVSRFIPAWAEESSPVPVRDVAGYRKPNGDGWDYYVTTPAWKDELCRGFDAKAIAGILADRGYLIAPDRGPHRAKSLNVPGHGKQRLYHLSGRILEDEA